MLISHLSDLHLGYSQFNLEEREEDVYENFREALDISVKEGAQLVILAGDIFHTPRPNGKAIATFANGLKKLKEKEIPVAFVLGEHDISRIRDVPLPLVFSNLGLARRLRPDEALVVGDCMVIGIDKERKSNLDALIEKLNVAGQTARSISSSSPECKKILVLHQGLVDFNKFAGEISSSDLPNNFDYYALGHYHDHIEKKFNYLQGPLVYPGSIDLTPSEGIKDVDKGFILADLSGDEPSTQWIKLASRRPQFSVTLDYANIANEVAKIIEKAKMYGKKPVISLKIEGKNIDSKVIANSLVALNDDCLHYTWRPVEETQPLTVYDGRPVDIEQELYRLANEALKSDELAKFVVSDILQPAADGDASTVLDIVWKAYKGARFKNTA